MKAFIPFLSLALGVAAQAQSNLPAHQQRLAEIQSQVQLSINTGFSFMEQVEAVQKLHDLVVRSPYGSYFSRNGLIQSVQIRKPYTRDSSDDEIQFLAMLRGHMFYFTNDGRSGAALVSHLAQEQALLTEIQSYEEGLQSRLPKLKITRQGEYLTGALSPNSHYRDLLENMDRAARTENLYPVLSSMEHINFISTGDHVGGLRIQRATHWGDNSKQDLFITVPQPWGYMKVLEFYPQFMTHALTIVLEMGFQSIESELLEMEETPHAVKALYERLNPETIAKLKSLGVESFEFSSNWATEESWIKGHRLILGAKTEDINFVLDFLTAH
jgi:hypothetical protein